MASNTEKGQTLSSEIGEDTFIANVAKMTPAELADAQRAALEQHQLSFSQAFAKYKKAIGWSVVVSMAIVMESYDTILLSSFYAYPTFQEKFGDQIGPNTFSVPAPWQIALSLGSNIGIIIGIFANGVLIDKYGHRWVLQISIIVLTGFIALTFAASSRGMLLAGQILSGLPWGTINTIAPSYAIETAPLALRHYTPVFVNLCWVIGHLIGAGVLDGLVSNTTEWGWRIPFALQWMFPLPIFIAICFAPDSPWWLVRKGKQEKAIKTLDRLSTNVDTHQTAALIHHTVELERELNFGSTYWDCFKGVDLRRTEVAVVTWVSQNLVGFAIQGYNSYFFQQAGLPASSVYKLTLGVYSLAFVGTSISMPLQSFFGRRQIWFAGLIWMFICMFLIGILGCVQQTPGIKWAQAILLLIWFFGYGWSAGPLPYVICSEVGSAKLRQKTISLSRNAYYVISIVNTVAAPYLLNPAKADLKGKAAFVPAGLIVLVAIWSFFRLPETKGESCFSLPPTFVNGRQILNRVPGELTPEGKSFEELDIMFHKGVPARQFATYVVHKEFAEAELQSGSEAAKPAQ